MLSIRTIALGVFDAINAHPWIGSALTSAPGLSPIARILERVGQQVRNLGVPHDEEWAAVGASWLTYSMSAGRMQ